MSEAREYATLLTKQHSERQTVDEWQFPAVFSRYSVFSAQLSGAAILSIGHQMLCMSATYLIARGFFALSGDARCIEILFNLTG